MPSYRSDREAAAVRLPDDVLQQLVQDRWTEIRPMEIDGGSQDMVSLHAKVVFDADMQQRIKTEAQRLVIGKRVRGGAVVFGGVLGLLALAWGGLRYAAQTAAGDHVGWDKLAVRQAFQPDKQVRLESLTYGELRPTLPPPPCRC